jgi:hypothetical protein
LRRDPGAPHGHPHRSLAADPKDATTYASAPQVRHFDKAEFKGLLDLNFSILWAQLQKEEWDLDRHALEEVWMKENGEEWLFRFPVALVERLAQLESPAVADAAANWARTEELQWPPSEIEPVLLELIRLA